MPQIFNSVPVSHDNMTLIGTSNSLSLGTGRPPTAEIGFSLDNPYAFTGPNAQTSQAEDSVQHPTMYPVKIAPDTDGVLQKMNRGDICFSYNTDGDMKFQNDVYTILPIWQINKGALQKAMRANPDRDAASKRQRVASTVSTYQCSDRYIQMYPSNATEFKREWNWSGVLQNQSPSVIPNLSYKTGYNINVNNLFKVCSMAIFSVVRIPCLIYENVKNGQNVFIVGSNVEQTFESVWDLRGRKMGSNIMVPSFHLRLITTPDNSYPSFLEHRTELIEEREIAHPTEDPITGQRLPYHIPPIKMSIRTVETPYILPLGKIQSLQGSIPTPDEVSKALCDPDKYKQLLADSPLTIHLNCRSVGPYDWHM